MPNRVMVSRDRTGTPRCKIKESLRLIRGQISQVQQNNGPGFERFNGTGRLVKGLGMQNCDRTICHSWQGKYIFHTRLI